MTSGALHIGVALEIPVIRVFLHEHRAAATLELWPEELQRSNTKDVFTGWLVGASDGKHTGFWGPVPRQVGNFAVELFDAVENRMPTSPGEWAERVRLGTRHAHSGILAAAVGAIELAIWDLAGWRADAPVWALCGGAPQKVGVQTYATCFGLLPDQNQLPSTIRTIWSSGWPVQKWRPPPTTPAATWIDEVLDACEDPARLAIDLCGRLTPASTISICSKLPCELAWLEEPVPPWRLLELANLPISCPIAAGEHCYSVQDVILLETVDIGIWQPDAVFCGGFENLIQVMSRAHATGRSCVPHGGGLLPAIHAAALGQPIDYLEWHLTLEPRRQAHLENPTIPDSTKRLRVPDRPGWAGRISPTL